MSNSKKRSFSDFLGSSNTPKPPPSFSVPKLSVTTEKWSDLTDHAVQNRALITKHSYATATGGLVGKVKLSHSHGEFKKRIGEDLNTHNIATARFGRGAQSFPKIIGRMDPNQGATDALRVLKGTHLTKGLQSATPGQRQAAVEMGVEIGISEYSRGTTAALADASINLYRIKHGRIALSDFSDHTVGYSGAGDGGAKRLRGFSSLDEVFSQYGTSLRAIYDTHASQKPTSKRKWEKTLSSKAGDDEKFAAWQFHKFKSWTQRE